MALIVDELAIIVDSTVSVCLNEATGNFELTIEGLQIRVGAGPELRDVVGVGADADAARTAYAVLVANQVVVVGGNPRGVEVRVPSTIIGF